MVKTAHLLEKNVQSIVKKMAYGNCVRRADEKVGDGGGRGRVGRGTDHLLINRLGMPGGRRSAMR